MRSLGLKWLIVSAVLVAEQVAFDGRQDLMEALESQTVSSTQISTSVLTATSAVIAQPTEINSTIHSSYSTNGISTVLPEDNNAEVPILSNMTSATASRVEGSNYTSVDHVIPSSLDFSLQRSTLSQLSNNSIAVNTTIFESSRTTGSVELDSDVSYEKFSSQQSSFVSDSYAVNDILHDAGNDTVPNVQIDENGEPQLNTTTTHSNSNETDFDEDPESRFMSFEEWKRQKVGEEPPAKKIKTQNGKLPTRQINQNINGVIGEDMEIDIEMFSGSQEEDEGGKLYKDRFNYASFDCAATIVKTNSEAKGAAYILNENKDSYLLNECGAANKFVTIELCEDILVDTVMLGNYEFFSSTFKKIRLSVSDRFPVPINGWKVLGEFDADNVRALQTFHVKNPLIWARYLRVEVLSYYGNEYYCPISVIRVHGQTMMDEFKNEEEREEQADREVEYSGSVVENNNSTFSSVLNTTNSTTPVESGSLASFNTAIVDPERFNTLNEECSVVLPHLGIEQFLQDFYATENDTCKDPEVPKPMPIETKEPTTQESIYKNIVKRLSLLESNASLSLLYIEEQSKLLSNAFTKLEKRQTTKFEVLVSAFNESIHAQIDQMKHLYTNLHKETGSILFDQRLTHQQLLFDASKKLNNISSELTFFRRLAIFNTCFILCLLAYVVATREASIETEYVDDYEDTPMLNSPIQLGSPKEFVDGSSGIEKLMKRKKKIKVSVSHKFSGGSSPISTGNFYFESNGGVLGNSSDDISLKHRRSFSNSMDSGSIKSGMLTQHESKPGEKTRHGDASDDGDSVELEMNQH